MSKKNRALLLFSLIPASLLVSVPAVVQAQGSAAATKWSDPATWPNGKVPAAGEKVVIARDKNVVLDVSPPALGGLSIDGKLTFANTADLELTTEWIMLHGELAIGSEGSPHTRKATITLTDNVKGEDVMAGMGDRGIMISGGTLNLHGDRTHAWTKLSATAEKGATRIQVLDASGWRVGDQIVLASTDFNPRQAEVRTVTAINGTLLTLDKPLDFMHFGKVTFDVDERGEVGLLSRNVKIQASEDAAESFFGGHIMAMPSSKMYVSGVELNRMGQNLTLARYPIHWHLVGDATGQYIRNSAIHDTFNRCVTVHGTHNLRVENNVTYNNVGHCFFIEDGIETGNWFVRNLAIQTKCHTSNPCVPTNLAPAGEMVDFDGRQVARQNGQQSPDVLLPSDNTVSSFWITNPQNHYVDNVAAGSDANGFWMSLPEHPNGQFLGTEVSLNTWPRNMPLGTFKGNVAHSNYDGFMFDRNIAANNTFGVTGNMHISRENPADPASPIVEQVFEDLTAYKNRNGGFWGRGENRTIRNYKAADNAIGYTQATGLAGGASVGNEFTSRVVDSLFVGETENVGNPTTPEEIAYGRSLPKPIMPDFPVRGYEYYDARHDVINTTFRNFEDNEVRKTGALSYLLYTSFGVSSNNTIEKVKFENAKPVYFPPMEREWGNDNGNSQAYRTAVIRDKDGSLGAGPAYVLIHDGVNDSVATDEQACEIKSTWNAAVCRGDVGRLSFAGGPGGGGRGGGPRAGGAPRAGGPGAAGPGARAGGPGAAAPGARAGGPGGPVPAAGQGAAPRAGGPGAGGRGGGAFGGGAAQPPITLSRNGKDHVIVNGGSNVRAGTEIKLTTERPTLTLRLTELDQGSWVIFQLPGFNTAAGGTQQSSLDALRRATETSYFKDADALWVKVVSPDNGPIGLGGTASIQVDR